jgi:hypothetical protein
MLCYRSMKKTVLKLGLSFCFALAPLACGGSNEEPAPETPIGPVAKNAAEAWPERPQNVPAISAKQIAEACVLQAACIPAEEGVDRNALRSLVDLCAHDAAFSAERAIVLSGFVQRNERAEFFVDCTLKTTDCNATRACATERPDHIYCEEDGCRLQGSASYSVSCSGDIATLSAGSESVQRDCSRAFAQCSETSVTGCTDRHFSACDEIGIQAGDRCDGDIRLGCDGATQVSYRDCSRLGGSCEQNGRGACVYPDADVRCTADKKPPPQCQGAELSLCVGHAWVTVDAPAVCPE